MTAHLSTLTLHQLRYGELSADQHQRAAAHLEGCERCRRRLHVQERTREEHVLSPVPEALRPAPAPQPSPWARWLRSLAPIGIVAAAALVSLAVPEVRELGRADIAEQTRTKGDGASLEIWVDRGGARPLRPDEALEAGDTIQVLYDPVGAEVVTLAGRDPSGAAEVWGTLEPEREGLQPAPFALTLDATPGYQEVLVIRSHRPLTPDELARVLADRPAPNGVTVESVLLPKR